MTGIQLYMALRRNMRLCESRSPLSEQNVAGQVLMVVGFMLIVLYMVSVGITLGLAARGGHFTLVFAFMPLMLPFDFLLRLGVQQTPTVIVKPYLLLPIKRRSVIDCFLVYMLVDKLTCAWAFLFLPYGFICFCGGQGLMPSVLMPVVCLFLFIVNGQWYLLSHTLAGRNAAFWLMPAAVYCATCGLWLYVLDIDADLAIGFCAQHGFTALSAMVYVAVFAALFVANRRALLQGASAEVARSDAQVAAKRVLRLGAFDAFGRIGEYLKLEVKSALRNKTVRQRYLSGFFSVALLSAMTAYTDVYDGDFMRNMWCLYSFVLFGTVNLVRVMGVEGNYMDLLMTQRENLFMLLRAKYYFYCAVLVLPLLILAPAIVAGKYTPLMVVAYILTTSGTEYFLLFQLAVYNKQTTPLTQSVSGKGSFENTMQVVVNVAAFFFPVLLAMSLALLFGSTVAYGIMCVLGLALTLTHKLWLRNVYERMMHRKYANIEGFHATKPH